MAESRLNRHRGGCSTLHACPCFKAALPTADHDMVLMKASPHILHILQASSASLLLAWANMFSTGGQLHHAASCWGGRLAHRSFVLVSAQLLVCLPVLCCLLPVLAEAVLPQAAAHRP